MPCVIFGSPRAAERRARACAWLKERPRGEEVLLLAPTLEGAASLARAVGADVGGTFGWHRTTLARLAATVAAPQLAARGLAPVGQLPLDALASRVVQSLMERGRLGRFAAVVDFPGLPRAIARTLLELRMEDLGPAALREGFPEFVDLHSGYEEQLARAKLADRALVFRVAIDALERRPEAAPIRAAKPTAQLDFGFLVAPKAAAKPPAAPPTAATLAGVGRRLLALDVSLGSALERDLLRALAAQTDDVLVTVPDGDEPTLARVRSFPGATLERSAKEAEASAMALRRLQDNLFSEDEAPAGQLDDSVTFLSAPGESREAVEIARRIHREMERGVALDRIAVLLRAPRAYTAHLEEALRRAKIPAYFARGTVRPDPAGRAFLALLHAALEQLSARRFAEYLSLAQVPKVDPAGAPPPAADEGDRHVPPDDEMSRALVANADDDGTDGADDTDPEAEDDALAPAADQAPVAGGTLRAPRFWEKLIVDASVIGGGVDRWRRRLAAYDADLAKRHAELVPTNEPAAAQVAKDRANLGSLAAFALPLLADLAALPRSATWGEHLDHLTALATRALKAPERVLGILAELAPMSQVGPVELADVVLVLSRRLAELVTPPPPRPTGRVFVGPIDAARGLAFQLVFVPGLAERIFPQRVMEDPILRDEDRLALELTTNRERGHAERLALRVAVGAATDAVVVSYPRVDLEQSRPRVPSFYGLELLRAAEGTLPGFDELARRAERGGGAARIGWPAPASPEVAIDEAEYDLALLDGIFRRPEAETVGAAHYLLSHPHLARALRFRARRWNLRKWTSADGLVDPTAPEALAALAKHGLAKRSFSATALQNFAACPYRFLLLGIHKLAPRQAPEAIEELDPLQKGSLVHEVLYQLYTELKDASLLPVREADLDAARARLDRVVKEIVDDYAEKLAPAIPRVWDDGVETIVADLREWLRRAATDATWTPRYLELSFGLVDHREGRDVESRDEPAKLACGIQLRGSIDFVEKDGAGHLRATDYKTGKKRAEDGIRIAGGKTLQPILYALALEALFPDATVEGGRLYYATTTGGFETVDVALDAEGRAGAEVLAAALGGSLAQGFFPAAPEKDACTYCDAKRVCGSSEERRAARKAPEPLALLKKLRAYP